MSIKDPEPGPKKIDSLLSDFFHRERPRDWPLPPWPKPAERTRVYRKSWGKLAGLAALLLASVGLSCLSDVPGTWPENKTLPAHGTLEAKRKGTAKKPAKLPGTSLPEDSKLKSSPRNSNG